MDTQKAVTTINQGPAASTHLEMLGSAANHAAAHTLLRDYQSRKSQETLRRQVADITLFETYLAQAGLLLSDMASNLDSWYGVTWGLVEGFNRWSLTQGYAIGSVNVRLATVKAYCSLAAKAGTLDKTEMAMIKAVSGFRAAEGRNIDEKRVKAQTETRRTPSKKAEPVSISLVHAKLLKQQPASNKKGKRDALLMCLLLDHGLRVGEISDLDVSSIDLAAGTLTFYRHKVHMTQTHQLTADTYLATKAYLEQEKRAQAEPLFVGSCSGERMSERTINARIAVLGSNVGLASLSPHDCRHYWATNAVRTGTDIKSLQDAGGWSSPAMPLRYAASSKIANQGVKLTV